MVSVVAVVIVAVAVVVAFVWYHSSHNACVPYLSVIGQGVLRIFDLCLYSFCFVEDGLAPEAEHRPAIAVFHQVCHYCCFGMCVLLNISKYA